MKSTSIIFITCNTINKHLSHSSQMHTHAYIWRVHHLEPYSGIQGRRKCLWTLVDPDMYMHHMDIFPLLFLIFSFLISSQKTLSSPTSSTIAWETLPIITASCITSPPPIFSCLVNILLLFIRIISPYFICINRVDTTLYSISIWVLYSLSHKLSKSWYRLHCSYQAPRLLSPVTS